MSLFGEVVRNGWVLEIKSLFFLIFIFVFLEYFLIMVGFDLILFFIKFVDIWFLYCRILERVFLGFVFFCIKVFLYFVVVICGVG